MTHPSPTALEHTQARELARHYLEEVPTPDETLGSIKDGCAMARYILSLEAEAQLATRLPTEAQISYLLEVLAKEGVANAGGDFMRRKISKAILALLSGAATPAPTAALTEEHEEYYDDTQDLMDRDMG